MIEEVTDTLSDKMLILLKIMSENIFYDYNSQLLSFQENLFERWGEAFELLELLIRISYEAGETYNKEQRPIAAENKDYIFEVLVRLHARSCQVASEILTLLKFGFADGAHARWRTLHELSVVAILINSKENELAERYLLHDAVESYKAAKIYQEDCQELGFNRLDSEEFISMKNAYNDLTRRFGDSYKSDYGWASEVVGNPKPEFWRIEKFVGLKHLRPYYKMACHNVHANSRGIFFRLGLYPESELLLAGPSNVGLADPGHLTAISLARTTISMLTHSINIYRMIVCDVMQKLEQEIGKAFFKTHKSLEDDRKTVAT